MIEIQYNQIWTFQLEIIRRKMRLQITKAKKKLKADEKKKNHERKKKTF